MKFFAIAACAALILSAQNSDRSVPIENDQVKVLKVTQKPHQKTRLHKHDMNRVMIYLQAGTQTVEYPDAKPSLVKWKAGEALWSPKVGMHTAEIDAPGPITIVELELKNPGRKVALPALDPLKVAPKLYKVEMENDQVRIVRSKIGPRGTVPLHEHGLNRVVVYLTDQNFKITNAEGKVDQVKHQAGDVSWGTPVKHQEENLSDQPFEILIVEIK